LIQSKSQAFYFPLGGKMDPKYSNIFWHQGVRIFEEEILKNKKGRVKVVHFENCEILIFEKFMRVKL
jgi:hypothetical protein